MIAIGGGGAWVKRELYSSEEILELYFDRLFPERNHPAPANLGWRAGAVALDPLCLGGALRPVSAGFTAQAGFEKVARVFSAN